MEKTHIFNNDFCLGGRSGGLAGGLMGGVMRGSLGGVEGRDAGHCGHRGWHWGG
jgi:hypothetical protein